MELQKSNNSKKKSKTKSNFKLNYQPKPGEVKKIQKISESSQPPCGIRYEIENRTSTEYGSTIIFSKGHLMQKLGRN